MVTWHILHVCRWEPDCSVVLVEDVCSQPLFWGRSRSFTVLTATNAALAAITSVYLHMHKISLTEKMLTSVQVSV